MIEPVKIELPEVFMKSVNAWLFLEPEPTLVDCGEDTDESWNALQNALRGVGLQIKDIKRIVITHAHVDHMGMAQRIAKESGAKVWLSEYAYEWGEHLIQLWDTRFKLIKNQLTELIDTDSPMATMLKNSTSMFGNILNYWKVIDKEFLVKFDSTKPIELGGVLWEVIYLPGHSPSQTCFFHKASGYLISADMLLSITPTPVIDVDPLDPEKKIRGLVQMLSSYKILQQLPITKVFPGHYDSFENANEVMEQQIARIHMRKDACLALIKEGKNSFEELFKNLYPNRFHMPAISMLIGYLELLEEEDKIRKQYSEGKVRFEIL